MHGAVQGERDEPAEVGLGCGNATTYGTDGGRIFRDAFFWWDD